MEREFIHTTGFESDWKDLKLGDEELRQLESILLKHPKIGVEVDDVPGLRKMRLAIRSKGKRGGARVLYVDYEIKEKIILIMAYAKSEKDDLTGAEANAMRRYVKILKEVYK